MSKFGHLGSKSLKTNVKFKISTFKIGYVKNFVKIRNFILFGPKYLNLGNWLEIKKKNKFEISTFKTGACEISLRLERKSILFAPICPNLDIWARNLKNEN